MPDPFAFATAASIRFGRGIAAGLVPEIAALGTRVLLVTGANPGRAAWLADGLRAKGCTVTPCAVPGEPDLAMIAAGVALARGAGVQAVVAIGGGAAIDAGKAIAAMVPATRPLLDHLEVVGLGLPLDHAPLPFVAMPTTAGTGAEVTRNAVIAVPEQRRKVSLRDARMLPHMAVVDPALTDHCPRAITLASGLDAITQVIEPYVCTRANPLTDALCRAAIPVGLHALNRLMQGEDAGARDDMAWVSLCGGLALANAGLGVVHGLAGPLGGLSGAAHGALCGAMLPAGLLVNAGRVSGSMTTRFDEIAGWIAGVLGGASDDAFQTLAQWSRDQGLPGLDGLGVSQAERDAAAQAAATSSSMKANPVPLSLEDLNALLLQAR
jgi:alcohol dehydrogenase class IV